MYQNIVQVRQYRTTTMLWWCIHTHRVFDFSLQNFLYEAKVPPDMRSKKIRSFWFYQSYCLWPILTIRWGWKSAIWYKVQKILEASNMMSLLLAYADYHMGWKFFVWSDVTAWLINNQMVMLMQEFFSIICNNFWRSRNKVQMVDVANLPLKTLLTNDIFITRAWQLSKHLIIWDLMGKQTKSREGWSR